MHQQNLEVGIVCLKVAQNVIGKIDKEDSKMTKQEALQKIEELQKFVGDLDKQEQFLQHPYFIMIYSHI